MPEQDDNPFTEADLTELQQKMRDLDRADRIIQRAKRGGLDMTTLEETSRELRTQLTKLKNAFFPGR
jgi:hypothetical protein